VAAVNSKQKQRQGRDRCVYMQDDELADVRLEGRTLVTDSYRDWIVPHEAERFDSVWDWWQHLASRDRKLPEGAADYVKEIIDVCPTHIGRNGQGRERPASRQRTRLCVERLHEIGLTLEQISDVTGFTGDQLLGVEMHKAYQQLLAGRSASEAHAAAPSTTLSEVRRFAKVLAGEPVKRVYPKSMHTEAFELLASGLNLRQTAEALNERHGTSLTRLTVGTWVSRNRKKVQQ
jgi:hypothetical protein